MIDTTIICRQCDRVQPPPYAGSCICLEDGHDIRRRKNYCPLKKFGTGIAPANWTKIPIDVTKFGKPLPPAPAPTPISEALATLGQSLLASRKLKNLTQCGAGSRVGVSGSIIAQIEMGALDDPSLREKLAALYATSDPMPAGECSDPAA